MSDASLQTHDAAVHAVLCGAFSRDVAQQWLATWQAVRRQRTSVYDAIVTFVNVLEERCATDSSAWLRVLLIDAVTQAEHGPLELA
jgi:hypothetical protein